jgi:F0F1-type ATP synthase membrane subunit b/b'
MNKGYFILAVLIFIAITKEILVFNEETLVLVSFILFILLMVKYAKSTVIEELEGKANAIEQEIASYYKAKEEILQTLIEVYKVQTSSLEDVQKVHAFAKENIQNIFKKRNATLRNQFFRQVESKLERLNNKEKMVVTELQEQIINAIESYQLDKAKSVASIQEIPFNSLSQIS